VTNSTASIIGLDNLVFGWGRSDDFLLEVEHLHVARGERVFLHGPSGSGKTTLLSLIAGVLLPQTGTVRILERELNRMNGAARDRFRADHIGIIFQQFNLIPYLSVVENVTLPCYFSPLRRHNAKQRSQSPQTEALRLLEHLDMAHARIIDKPVAELSVGQQQRVAAARALIGSPEILIADEPTSSMDADRRQAFIDLLFRECAELGSTLVFVSHDKSLLESFDRHIDFGRSNPAPAGDSSRLREVS